MKNIIVQNSPGLSILKKFFAKEYFSFTELFASIVNTGKILLNADFGFICNKQKNNIYFFYATENPYFTGSSFVPVSDFNNYNIFLPQKETISTEIRNSSADPAKSGINFRSRLSYISTPVFLLDKVFAYLLFFKSAGMFNDEDYVITENISKFLSSQIDKLSAFKEYTDTKAEKYESKNSISDKNSSSVYLYNIKNKSYSVLKNSIFQYLNPESFKNKDRIDFNSGIKEIIHPDDIIKFDKRLEKLNSLKLNQLNECRYRLKDSTDNWRFFYHRDIVYYLDEYGETAEILIIIQEEDIQPGEQDDDIRRFIKTNLNNNKTPEMAEQNDDLFDLNIIQNLKELGGDDDITFLKEVFDLYIEQAPGIIGDIKKSYSEQNTTKLAQSAHALKGASLNIGAKKFADICKQIEMKGKENSLENVDLLLKELDENFLLTSNGLKKFL